jgi:transposase-like protein
MTMMRKKRIRKRHGAEVKAQVAMAAMRERETTAQIAVRYGVHPTQVSSWKKQAKESMAEVFSSEHPRQEQDHRELVDELYKQIGQLTIQLDWLKKKCE